jgi:protein-tyrosine phosphatase
MSTAELPPPREGRSTYRIALVCLGNICRSPMAAVVLEARLETAGLADRVRVASAGTGCWHVGERMDQRAAATLVAHGHDPSRHRAAQLEAAWFDRFDLLLAMDAANLQDVRALAPDDETAARVRLFREFDPVAVADDREVPDPWFGGQDGFDLVLAIVTRTADELVRRLDGLLSAEPR